MFVSNNLRDLRKLKPVASARRDKDGVIVFSRIFYYPNTVTHYYPSEDEMLSYVVRWWYQYYEDAIAYQKKTAERRQRQGERKRPKSRR